MANYETNSSNSSNRLEHSLYCLYCSPLNFLSRANWKIMFISNFFSMKNLKRKREIWKRKQINCIFQKNVYGRDLSIRVFSSAGQYEQAVSLRWWTSRHGINLNQ